MRYITIQDAEQQTGITRKTLISMCRRGKVPGVTRLSKHFLIPRAWVDEHRRPACEVIPLNVAARKAGVSRWIMMKAINDGRLTAFFIRRDRWTGGYICIDAKWTAYLEAAKKE